MDTEALEYAGC